MEYGQRRLLPTCSGVYCVMTSGGMMLYIGESQNIRQRWRGHHLKPELKSGSSLRIAWRETFGEAGRMKMQALLIRRHQPRLNGNLLGRATPPKAVCNDQVCDMLTTREAAERMQVSEASIRVWLNDVEEKTRRFPNAIKFGRDWQIPESDVSKLPTGRKRGRPSKLAARRAAVAKK